MLLAIGPNHTVSEKFQHEGGGADLLADGLFEQGITLVATGCPFGPFLVGADVGRDHTHFLF